MAMAEAVMTLPPNTEVGVVLLQLHQTATSIACAPAFN
jgi:hypothetical protein